VLVGDRRGLEEILEGDAHLALDAADGLLEQLRERRVRFRYLDLVLEFVFVVEHGWASISSIDCQQK
jgi:hypothetical protein